MDNIDIIEEELKLDVQHSENDEISTRGYLAKLTLALTIPSFCSSYIKKNDSEKGYGSRERERYPRWCNEYLDFPQLTSNECYAARCALSHCGDDLLEEQSILKYGDEVVANKYSLSIPYAGTTLNMVKELSDNVDEKSFCSNALIVSLLKAYKKFKEDYPDFVYPLQGDN